MTDLLVRWGIKDFKKHGGGGGEGGGILVLGDDFEMGES